MGCKSRAAARRAAFTRIEMVIGVIILGVIAAVVVPQFTSSAVESREGAVKLDLYRVRTQIAVYRQQHDGRLPTLTDFEYQLTGRTSTAGAVAPATGNTDAAAYPLGPYLPTVPVNPRTGGRTLGTGPPGTSDWYYDQKSGAFMANDSADSRRL